MLTEPRHPPLVRVHFSLGGLVPSVPARSRGSSLETKPVGNEATVKEWPYLDEVVLRTSRKVCLTCHFFRHHACAICISLLTSQLNQALLVQCEHLTRRCQG